MGVHQPRYLKVEEKKYEQHEEPIGKIAEVYIPSTYVLSLLTLPCCIDNQPDKRGELSILSLFFAKTYTILEVVVRQISRRFDSVRHDLHTGHQSILQGTLEHLERMHEERFFFALSLLCVI